MDSSVNGGRNDSSHVDVDIAQLESNAVYREQKWTDPDRIVGVLEELKEIGDQMAGRLATGGHEPSIFRVPNSVREISFDKFKYSPEHVRLGLYNRGEMQIPTEAENLRMKAVIAFMERLNESRSKHDLNRLEWPELVERVVPKPARMKVLYKDCPSPMENSEVQYLLTIDAVYLLCLFRTVGDCFEEVKALDKEETGIEKPWDDFLLLENQIPLELIENALAVALEGEPKYQQRATIQNPEEGEGTEIRIVTAGADVNGSMDPVQEKDFREEFAELLSESVLKEFCWQVGLFSYIHNALPLSEIKSSNHLLHCVYKKVTRKPVADESTLAGKNSKSKDDPVTRGDHSERLSFCSSWWTLHYWRKLALMGRFSATTSDDDDLMTSDDRKEYQGAWMNCYKIPTASQLKKAGICIKDSDDATIWDTKVVEGIFRDTLLIPKLELSRCTANALRNLLVTEMTQTLSSTRPQYPLKEYITILRRLVETTEDAAILCRDNEDSVIFCSSGASFVVDMLNNIGLGVWTWEDSLAFRKFCKDIQRCYRKRRKRMFWEFVNTYLNKPWKIASLTAALVLLVLTFLQTLYSMLTFY